MGIGIGILVAVAVLLSPAILILRSDRARGLKKSAWVLLSLSGIPIYLVWDAALRQSYDPSDKAALFQYMAQRQQLNLICLAVGWLAWMFFLVVCRKRKSSGGEVNERAI